MPRLTAARALAVVVWDDEEEKLIRQVHGKRNKLRELQRLMHNRTAEEKGHHIIERYKSDGKIRCQKCGQCSDVKRMTQWPKTRCEKNEVKKEGRGRATERGKEKGKPKREKTAKGKSSVKKNEGQKKKKKKSSSSS